MTVGLAWTAACAGTPGAPSAEAVEVKDEVGGDTFGDPTKFEAVVDIDDTVGGKRFQGVWLVDDAGKRWLVRYRPDPAWTAREGKRFVVTGRPYTPDPRAQQINADHFRVDEVKPAR